MLGLGGATSHHACAWCKIHKDKRSDMSYDLDYYNSPPMQRNIAELKQMAKKKTGNFCKFEPLLNIDLDHVVLDELHLLLHVVDVLIENLVMDVLEWDKRDDLNTKRGVERGVHLEKLKVRIRSCGVSFDIWKKRDADGKGAGKYDFTSLLGTDKKKLLKELPSKLSEAVQPDTSETVATVWQNFREIYSFIGSANPSDEDITEFFEKAKSCITEG